MYRLRNVTASARLRGRVGLNANASPEAIPRFAAQSAASTNQVVVSMNPAGTSMVGCPLRRHKMATNCARVIGPYGSNLVDGFWALPPAPKVMPSSNAQWAALSNQMPSGTSVNWVVAFGAG